MDLPEGFMQMVATYCEAMEPSIKQGSDQGFSHIKTKRDAYEAQNVLMIYILYQYVIHLEAEIKRIGETNGKVDAV